MTPTLNCHITFQVLLETVVSDLAHTFRELGFLQLPRDKRLTRVLQACSRQM